MRIAIPLTQGTLSPHFGHCDQFAILDVDRQNRKILSVEHVTPPAHQPGVLPKWLAGLCVELIIASGMGQRAQQLFAQSNISVLYGAPDGTTDELVLQYLNGTLVCGENVCDR